MPIFRIKLSIDREHKFFLAQSHSLGNLTDRMRKYEREIECERDRCGGGGDRGSERDRNKKKAAKSVLQF